MPATKKDFYEVLGVDEKAPRRSSRKPTASSPSATIRMPIPTIQERPSASRRLAKHIRCSPTRREGSSTIRCVAWVRSGSGEESDRDLGAPAAPVHLLPGVGSRSRISVISEGSGTCQLDLRSTEGRAHEGEAFWPPEGRERRVRR